MTQEEIRSYLGAHDGVRVQVAGPEDGSPAVAWGDTFFYVRDKGGKPKKMPFTTIVTKDYEGFDHDSKLNRGGLFRLNVDVGPEKFAELFGFRPTDFQGRRAQFDFTALNQLFPHPVYGSAGWVSIVNPAGTSGGALYSLLDFSLERALGRASK